MEERSDDVLRRGRCGFAAKNSRCDPLQVHMSAVLTSPASTLFDLS